MKLGHPPSRRFTRWLPAAGSAVLIFVVSSIPKVEPPEALFFPSVDKVIHAFVYLILAALLFHALRLWQRRETTPLIALAATLACPIYGGLIELYQPLIGRTMSLGDALANLVGALIVLVIYMLRKRRRKENMTGTE